MRSEACFLSTGTEGAYYCNMCCQIVYDKALKTCPKCKAAILTQDEFAKKYSNSNYGSGNYGKNKKEATP